MPYHKQIYNSGNLFIIFKVVFPEKLTEAQQKKIGEALSGQAKKEDVDMEVSETCYLQAFKEEHKNTHHEGGTSGQGGSDDEEEDHHGHGGQRVKCAQQ